jgi:hypothetical protein
MAKLLGARVAWANADNALQIHGGNGFALEYQISRVLCDARILNIFEGAGEIQAQVIARACADHVLALTDGNSMPCSTTAPMASPASSRTCQPTFCARSSKPMSSVGMT